jgi:hypothetical protein
MSSFSARSRASNQSIQQETTDQGICGYSGELVNRHGGHDRTADRGASRHCRLIAVRELLGVLCVLFRCKAARCVLRRTARDDEPLRGTRQSTTVPSSTPTPAIDRLLPSVHSAITRTTSGCYWRDVQVRRLGPLCAVASDASSSPAHSVAAVLSASKRPPKPTLHRPTARAAHLPSHRPRQAFFFPTRRRSVRFGSAFSASSFESGLLFALMVAPPIGDQSEEQPTTSNAGLEPSRRVSHGSDRGFCVAAEGMDSNGTSTNAPIGPRPSQHRRFSRGLDFKPACPYRTRQPTEKTSRHCIAVERYVGCCPLRSRCRLLALNRPFHLSCLLISRSPVSPAHPSSCDPSQAPVSANAPMEGEPQACPPAQHGRRTT